MDKKNVIIIVLMVIIICILSGVIFGILTNMTSYERMEITPNGTTIELPADELKYTGDINNTGTKMWTFKQGSVTTYNSEEALNENGLSALGGAVGFTAIENLVINHFEKQEIIDGYTVYTIDANKLGVEGRGIMYCIITGNNETHDNILIITDNKDMTLHIAKSIHYKKGNTNSTSSNDSNTIKNTTSNKTISGDSQSSGGKDKKHSSPDDLYPPIDDGGRDSGGGDSGGGDSGGGGDKPTN